MVASDGPAVSKWRQNEDFQWKSEFSALNIIKLLNQIKGNPTNLTYFKVHNVYKSYCSTVHFCRITSIYQPTNAHIISHKTLRHVSTLSDHYQGDLFLAKVILQYSQFNSYLQTRCCGSLSCCVGMCCGAVARCASYTTVVLVASSNVNTTGYFLITLWSFYWPFRYQHDIHVFH